MISTGSTGIPLVVGNWESGTSFTRFAFPFVWSLSDRDRGDHSFVYEPLSVGSEGHSGHADKEWLRSVDRRRRYFTPETANVLFDRALWFELRRNDVRSDAPDAMPKLFGDFDVCIGHRNLRLSIAPPRLVLFEAKDARHAASIAKTGFLLLDVTFPEGQSQTPTLEDLMVVNEMFRYWRCPFDGHVVESRNMPDGRTYSYAAVMGDILRGAGVSAAQKHKPSDCFRRWEKLLSFPVHTDRGLYCLIAPRAMAASKEWLDGAPKGIGCVPYTDERAFVWTCALTAGGAADFTGLLRQHDPKLTGEWVRFLNVDLPSNAEATEFEQQWVRDRTYERWKHYGTLYGFNMHSGAMIAAHTKPEPNERGEVPKPLPIWRHYSELYFDQVLLLLYLRVSLFRFKAELADASKDLPARRNQSFTKFRELRVAFAFLTNLYRYPALSSQQQGVEMYTKAREFIDIDDLFDEVQSEIETTHEMFELVSTSRMATVTAVLTYFVLFAGVYATLMAFLAAEDLEDLPPTREPVLRFIGELWPSILPSWGLLILSIPVVLLLVLVVRWQQRK